MSTFTRFAIVGAGGVGGVVARQLLKKNLDVTILTRDGSKVRGAIWLNAFAPLVTQTVFIVLGAAAGFASGLQGEWS